MRSLSLIICTILFFATDIKAQSKTNQHFNVPSVPDDIPLLVFQADSIIPELVLMTEDEKSNMPPGGCCRKYKIGNSGSFTGYVKWIDVYNGSSLVKTISYPNFPEAVILCVIPPTGLTISVTYTFKFYGLNDQLLCEHQSATFECNSGNNSYKQTGLQDGGNNQLGMEPLKITVAPNPASDKVTLTFTIPQNETATITLINSMGQKIRTMSTDPSATGLRSVAMDTQSLPDGIYYLWVNTKTQNQKELLIIKH